MAFPVPPNEFARLECLKSYRIPNTDAEQHFENLAFLAAALCEAPAAFVSFIDAERQWFKSAVGLTLRETSRDDSICAHTIMESSFLIIEDLVRDSRFRSSPLVAGEGFRFYAGIPIVSHDGYALGTVGVLDRRVRTLGPSQRDALLVLARHATDQLECHKRWIGSGSRLDVMKALPEELDTSLAYFRAILDTSRDGILVEDGETIRYMNPAYAHLYGAQSVDELFGEHLSNLAAPEDLERLLDYGKRRARGEPAPTQYEFRIRRKDGTLLDVEGTVSDFNLSGKHYIITFVRDIRDRKKNEREREELILKLQDALARVKTLSGLLPICASCKKIRDDQGDWKGLEEYVEARTEADFSHGICPDCARKLYPDVFEKD